jgi:hypothetical protein
MGRSTGFAAASHHLVEGTAIAECGVEVAAKLARATGARSIEAADDGMVDVFHKQSPGRGCNRFAGFVRHNL